VRGNPTQVDTTTSAGTTSALYTYDAVSRLRAECYPATGDVCVAKSPRNAYTYDLVGNRTSETSRTVFGTKATTVATDYTYDAAHQLLTKSVGGTATVTNTWSPNGALATSTTPTGTETYTTDLTDELISLTLEDGSTVGYTQDANGNRTSRTVDGLLDATWAWDDVSSLPMRIGEYDATGTLTTGWLPDPTSSTGASLAQTSGGVSSWLLSDPFTNTVATVSTTGNTVSGTRSMDAFGVERVSATGSLADASVGFAGQYLDAATGLYDMRARDYDPASGRFTATDPVAVPTGMPYVAGYSYSYNNPLMYSDPSGLTACGPIGSDCNGANLVPVFQRLAAANNETAYINLYQSLTEEQANQIPFDELSLIASESMNFQLHQMACEASPGECLAPCPEQGHARCELKRGAYFLAVYVAPLLLGMGAGALLERACAADAAATLATRTTAAQSGTRDVLSGLASKAQSTMGEGTGPVYGTKVHSAFASEINALGRSDLSTEVSYLNGEVVPYATRGSVRLDVVEGNPLSPTAVYDLKTGSAALTPARIAQIQANLPAGYQNIPVLEIRP